ncbi:MAG: DUF3987 domain-containing protein [Desulfovibrionaceae bacterium]|nr:DUF3987 domain-containing protein [Desulfovibrionaceae bacterium]
MSSDLWDEAMSAEPGTKSVERTVGQIGQGIQQGGERQGSAKSVFTWPRVENESSKEQEVENRSSQANQLVPQGNGEIIDFGGVYNQAQQFERRVAGHKFEKSLRTMEKEKEQFRKEDAFNYLKEEAYRRLAVTPVHPLPKQRTVDVPFPIHVFRGGAGKWITGFANAFGAHQCIGGGMLLGGLSVSAFGKFKVVRHNEHKELMAIYQLLRMDSGKGKSPMQDTVLEVIKRIEKRLQDEYFEGEGKRNIERRILTKRIRKLEKEAAESGDFAPVVEEIARIEMAMPPKSALPQLMTSKFTPEGLEKEAAKQGGKLAIIGTELGSFKNLPANKDDFILNAWRGETFISAKSKEPVRIDNPSLTILLATQEETSLKLLGDEALQEDGLVSRFMPMTPPDLPHVIPGGGVTTEMNPDDSAWLERTINEIHEIARKIDGHHEFRIQDGALRNWDAFWSYTQQQAKDERLPAVLRYWYRKLAGTALRISGFLHLLRCLEENLPLDTEIDQQAIDGGIELARFYEAHARVTFDIESNEVLRLANRFLVRIREGESLEFTMRDVYHPEHVKADDAKKVFRFLAEHGYVVLLRKGKSDICLANSRLWELPMEK